MPVDACGVPAAAKAGGQCSVRVAARAPAVAVAGGSGGGAGAADADAELQARLDNLRRE